MSESSNALKFENPEELKVENLPSDLSSLHILIEKKLTELNRLDKLENLELLHKLDNLSSLSQLTYLKELSKLESIQTLKDTLNEHQKVLAPLEKLDSLNHLEQLSNLKELTKLNELQLLSQLESLKNLDKLKALEDLDNLKSLRQLESLKKLDLLSSLDKLDKLEKLDNLKHLEKLDRLIKLDRLEDAKFIDRLERLDKLDILNKESKKLLFQQFAGFFLEITKFLLAGVCLIIFLTTERGQRFSSRILPVLGFGNAAQANLGLHMLSGQVSDQKFSEIAEQTRNKMKFEIEEFFTASTVTMPIRRLEILRQVKAYSFNGIGIDLAMEAEGLISKRVKQLESDAVEGIDYALGVARAKSDKPNEDYLRQIKILLLNKKFPEVLELILPSWHNSPEMVKAGLLAIYHLEKDSPELLDNMLSKPLIRKQQ